MYAKCFPAIYADVRAIRPLLPPSSTLPPVEIERSRNMLDLGRTFLQSVERSPDTLALVDGDVRLTYAQWYEIILRVAAGLRDVGVQPGDRLLVVLQNRWEMATLHWACQFSGIVMTPLNWRAKPDELDYCVTDSGAKAIVFEPVSADAVEGSEDAQKIPCIALDDAR